MDKGKKLLIFGFNDKLQKLLNSRKFFLSWAWKKKITRLNFFPGILRRRGRIYV